MIITNFDIILIGPSWCYNAKGVEIALYLVVLVLVAGFLLYWLQPRPVDFFRCYKDDPSIATSLRIFYAKPIRIVQVGGIAWPYYVGGLGGRAVLFIHGMGGSYDIWWQQLQYLERTHRVIAFTLPVEVSTLAEVERGVQALLDRERVDQLVVVGTSMGGYIAQYLMTRMPQRLRGVVLGHTFPPNAYVRKRHQLLAVLLRLLPAVVIRYYGWYVYRTKVFPAAGHSAIVRCFLLSKLFSKRSFLHRYRILIESFALDPERYRSIPKCIFESDNDPLVPAELRDALKATYPEATVYTFHSAGHFPYLNAADAYNTALRKCLEGVFDWV